MKKLPRRRKFLRWICGFAGFVAVALGAGLLAAATSLPRLDGTVRVAGLTAPAEILRDGNGVPHLRGRTREDIYFALGFAHAQDRLWQMDFNRHIVQGRLAALVGPRALKMDRLFRSLGLARHSADSVAALDPESRAALASYAAGVNAFISSHRGPWPPEFLLLRHAPEPWRPADSVAQVELMAMLLCANAFGEPNRAALARRLSPEQLRQFFPPYPADAPTITAELARLYRQFAGAAPLQPLGPPGASNNWVVDGAHSVTGSPLLANDTHLPLTAPALFYLADLGFSEGHAVGATLPGVPGIILGRTDRLAWGFTTTGSDVQDLYIEQVDPTDPGRYRTPEGWARSQTRTETIEVRGGAPETLVVRATRHGPVLPAGALGWQGPPDTVLALRWTLLDRPDPSIAAAIHIARARNRDDFVAAFRPYVAPMQNVVYADRDGHIGFLAPGLVPVRRPDHPTGGRMPAPGWQKAADWTGYIPFDDLPRARDPASGRLFSANNRIVGPSYPWFLGDDWDEPYRAERIAALLRARPRHDLNSFAAMQADVLSPLAADLLPALLAARPATDVGKAARAQMAGWDGRMAADAPQPLIFTAWLRALSRLVYADELGPDFAANWGYRPRFLRDVLHPGSPAARWCDDIRTPAAESCADRVGAALDQAATELAQAYGPDPSRWRWGAAHMACNSHRPFGGLPVLGALFDLCVASPGGAYTLDRGLTAFADEKPYANIHAAAFRGIYDLRDPDRSRFIVPTGQSGNVLSASYRNFLRLWRDGRTIEIPTRPAAVDAVVAHRLVLVPTAR